MEAIEDELSSENERIWTKSQKNQPKSPHLTKLSTFYRAYSHYLLLKMNARLSSILCQPPGVVTRQKLSVKTAEIADYRSRMSQTMRQNRPKLRINSSKTTEQSGSLRENMRHPFRYSEGTSI